MTAFAPVLCTTILALCGVVAVATRADPVQPARRVPNPGPVPLHPAVRVGIAMDAEGLYIGDWAEWMKFAPDAFEKAISEGVVGPRNILAHVLQRALPRHVWPPEPGSAYEEQYASLVGVVAEWISIGPEPQGPRLSVVK